MRLMSPVISRSNKYQNLLVGFGCAFGVFLLIPLSQMISFEVLPSVTPEDSAIVVDPPTHLEPPKEDEAKKEEVDIPPPEKEFKPPSISMLEMMMTVDVGGHAGVGQIIDPRMMGDELGEIIHALSDLTVVPEAIQQVSPVYPLEYKRNGIKGAVTVEFVVRSDGTTDRVRIIESTHGGFEDPAIKAVRRWIFRPGEKDGELVASRMRISIPFRIN